MSVAAGPHGRSGPHDRPRKASHSTTVLAALAAVLALVVLSAVALTPSMAKTECVSIVKREQEGPAHVLRFRNSCSFPVWAVVKNGDTGRYSYRPLNAGAEAADSAGRAYSLIVGWCKSGDADCLAEFGVRP
jgi:hypothetical protein